MKHVITLPYPISANRYWQSRTVYPKHGKPFTTTYVSSEAKVYKEQVAWLLKASGIREAITGRVQVHLQLYPHRPLDYQARMRKLGQDWDDTVQCLDLDNARKVVYDALKGIAFTDDDRIFRDSAERMEPDGEARVVVTIEPIVRVSPQSMLPLPEPVRAREAVPF